MNLKLIILASLIFVLSACAVSPESTETVYRMMHCDPATTAEAAKRCAERP